MPRWRPGLFTWLGLLLIFLSFFAAQQYQHSDEQANLACTISTTCDAPFALHLERLPELFALLAWFVIIFTGFVLAVYKVTKIRRDAKRQEFPKLVALFLGAVALAMLSAWLLLDWVALLLDVIVVAGGTVIAFRAHRASRLSTPEA